MKKSSHYILLNGFSIDTNPISVQKLSEIPGRTLLVSLGIYQIFMTDVRGNAFFLLRNLGSLQTSHLTSKISFSICYLKYAKLL